jgi:hypothetical protein
MIIGTLPDYQLRAIFQALIEERETGSRRFLENWGAAEISPKPFGGSGR